MIELGVLVCVGVCVCVGVWVLVLVWVCDASPCPSDTVGVLVGV